MLIIGPSLLAACPEQELCFLYQEFYVCVLRALAPMTLPPAVTHIETHVAWKKNVIPPAIHRARTGFSHGNVEGKLSRNVLSSSQPSHLEGTENRRRGSLNNSISYFQTSPRSWSFPPQPQASIDAVQKPSRTLRRRNRSSSPSLFVMILQPLSLFLVFVFSLREHRLMNFSK